MSDGIHKLTAAMAAGDEVAVGTFYRRYFDWLYDQARRATRRDEAFCLDVVQEAVLRVVRTIRAVETEPALRAWLKLVVRAIAYDQLRHESRRRRRELLAVVGRRECATSAGDLPDEEQIAWLGQEIARLDPKLVTMIQLRFQKGWTLQRIASALGVSAGTIDGRLRRALRQLRRRADLEERRDA